MFDLNDIRIRPRIPHEIMLIIGGWSLGSPTNSIETYDSRADIWQNFAHCDKVPRAYHGSIVIGNCIYIIGGYGKINLFCKSELHLWSLYTLKFPLRQLALFQQLPPLRPGSKRVARDGAHARQALLRERGRMRWSHLCHGRLRRQHSTELGREVLAWVESVDAHCGHECAAEWCQRNRIQRFRIFGFTCVQIMFKFFMKWLTF